MPDLIRVRILRHVPRHGYRNEPPGSVTWLPRATVEALAAASPPFVERIYASDAEEEAAQAAAAAAAAAPTPEPEPEPEAPPALPVKASTRAGRAPRRARATPPPEA